jgi:competence ComEA-like helix-hairpin-helix protein
MANILKEYLTFTNKERNGLLVLISLLVLVLIYLNVDLDRELEDTTDMAEFESELAALEQSSAQQREEYRSKLNSPRTESTSKSGKEPYVYHEFDPNFIMDEEWKEMGLKQWQINGLRNYREKAGDIETPEQFSKLNVVSDAFFEKVRPYLVFEGKAGNPAIVNKEGNFEKEETKTALSIEINIATAARLTELKGIGPAYSNRIVKYRNWLGGFRNLDQLLEVYGLEDSLYNEIIPFLILDTTRIYKININKVMIAELRKHPYVKWNIATAIVNYRDQHGAYENVADIKKTDLVSPELYRKIAPYFSVSK